MESLKLNDYLLLPRCPHCSIDTPSLVALDAVKFTTAHNGENKRAWRFYKCQRCGGIVTASGGNTTMIVTNTYPSTFQLSDVLPDRVKEYLKQAIDSIFAPSGSVMLSASAVDAMLKEKGYKDGSLYKRIDKAKNDGLITSDMAQWAHQVRLDANDERHADENATMPTVEDAKQSTEFAITLAELIYVLPSKVSRGIETTKAIPNP